MYESATKGTIWKKWQLRVSKIHFLGESCLCYDIEFSYVPKIFSMFFLLISGVGKCMFQNCCNLFKVYPHTVWTIWQYLKTVLMGVR